MALYSEVKCDILGEVSMYVSMEALQGWEMGRTSLSVCLQHLSYTLGCTSLHPGSPAIHIWGTVLLEGKGGGYLQP